VTRVATGVLALALMAPAPVLSAAHEDIARIHPARGELVAFVGEQLSMGDAITYDCGPDCWVFDVQFKSRYRPLLWLEGGAGTEPVDVSIWGHTEIEAMDQRTALLFAFKGKSLQLARYRMYEVDPTVDGRWAHCGDFDNRHAALVRPIAFREDIVVENVSRWPAQRIAKAFPTPTYELRGDEVHCTRGIYVEDLVPIVAAQILDGADE
jgi:hypothetical protein